MENNLRSLRRARGMTQEKLAKKSGINRVCIARYETGKHTMSTKSLLRLSQALGVSTDDLLKGGQTNGAIA